MIRCDNRPVFQAKKVHSIRTKVFTFLPDVKEALIISSKFKNIKDKEDYFMSVGLDYHKTIQYYDTVIELNSILDKTKSEKIKPIWINFFFRNK